ncbi:hypothetical protein [Paenibacillus kobensis]|uniref:hypothetical protein n=1 Tax=Paenibacillus kobensis TaxID=59841 RepID=UPI000FDA2D93|nr:hypothetical protein [Paenibacillus kobensis]
METKQLPVNDPFLKGYVHHACCFSIIDPLNNEQDALWFANQFIQLTCQTNIGLNRSAQLDFVHETFFAAYDYLLTIQNLHKNIIKKYTGGVIGFVIDRINEDNYIELMVNEFHLPGSPSYQMKDHNHNIFIYGYNVNEELVYARYMHNGSFSDAALPYRTIETAFQTTNDRSEWSQYTKLYKKKTGAITFDGKRFFGYIADYLNASCYFREDDDKAYGIAVYHYIIDYFDRLEHNETSDDIRILHLLWEHKRSMSHSMHYLSNNRLMDIESAVIEQVDTIENQTLLLRNLHLKKQIKQDKLSIKKIKEQLIAIKERETMLYTRLAEKRDNLVIY